MFVNFVNALVALIITVDDLRCDVAVADSVGHGDRW